MFWTRGDPLPSCARDGVLSRGAVGEGRVFRVVSAGPRKLDGGGPEDRIMLGFRLRQGVGWLRVRLGRGCGRLIQQARAGHAAGCTHPRCRARQCAAPGVGLGYQL